MTVVATGPARARGAEGGRGGREGGHLGRGRRPAHAAAARRGRDHRLGEEDEPLRRRARGGRRGWASARRSRPSSRTQAFDWLDAPIERVGAKFAPLPFAPVMEQYVVPHAEDVLEAVKRTVGELDGDRGQAPAARPGHGVRHDRQWLKAEGEHGREGRAALRARHRQGDAGGRGRGRRRPAEDRSSHEGEVAVGKTIAVIGEAGRGGRRSRSRAPEPRRAGVAEPRRRAGAGARARARARPRGRRARESAERTGPRAATAAGSRPRRSRAGSRASAGSTSRRSRGTGPGGADRRRGRRARRTAPRRRPPRRRPRRRQARSSVVELTSHPQDDRAPADRGLAGAGLPDLDVGRHDAARSRSRERLVERHPRTSAKPTVTDVLTKICAVALHAPPRRERALRRRRDPAASRPRTSGSRSRRRHGLVVPVIRGARAADDRRRSPPPAPSSSAARATASSSRTTSRAARSRSRTSACSASSSSSPCSTRRRRRSSRSARSRSGRSSRDGEVVVRPMMTLTLTCDHRAVDGATAPDFLRTVKELLEEPGLAL